MCSICIQNFHCAPLPLSPHLSFLPLDISPRTAPKTVFISYHPDESSQRKTQVNTLARQLQVQGFTVLYDGFCKKEIKQHKGINRWKEWCIQQAENIVVVCSPKYYKEDNQLANPTLSRKLKKPQIEVDCHLLREVAYSSHGDRLIPVVIDGDQPNNCVPIWLRSLMGYRWPSEKEDLVYCISGVPKYRSPPVVERIVLAPKEINFPEAYEWDPYDEEPPSS